MFWIQAGTLGEIPPGETLCSRPAVLISRAADLITAAQRLADTLRAAFVFLDVLACLSSGVVLYDRFDTE